MSSLETTPSPLARTLAWPTVRRNLVVALVVGGVLNLINQGTALAAWDGVSWWQFCLNFCVPFVVASFGSWNAQRAKP